MRCDSGFSLTQCWYGTTKAVKWASLQYIHMKCFGSSKQYSTSNPWQFNCSHFNYIYLAAKIIDHIVIFTVLKIKVHHESSLILNKKEQLIVCWTFILKREVMTNNLQKHFYLNTHINALYTGSWDPRKIKVWLLMHAHPLLACYDHTHVSAQQMLHNRGCKLSQKAITFPGPSFSKGDAVVAVWIRIKGPNFVWKLLRCSY